MKFWRRFSFETIGIALVGMVILTVPWQTLASSTCESNYGESSLTFEYVAGPEDVYVLEQPFGGETAVTSFGQYIQLVYEFSVGLVSIAAVVLIMIGGLRWIVAAGNESTITEAKEMITSAIMGLVIALLSYTLLLFINPQLTDLESSVAKIPLPLSCGTPDPAVVDITSIAGLNGGGNKLCPNAVTELQRLATAMRTTCPTCTIVVGSGTRTHEEQAALYECFTQSAAAAAASTGSTSTSFEGTPCVGGCSSCNVAMPPCCSNHEDGKAVDVYLEGSNVGLASSQGYLAGYNNNGGDGGSISEGAVGGNCSTTENPDLCLNQQKLREYMTPTDSKFKGISNEWWHFDFQGACSSASTTCQPINGKADNSYCKANGEDIYKLADCGGSTPTCPSTDGKSWALVEGNCATGQHYEFSAGQTTVSSSYGWYAAPPSCYVNP